MSIAPLHLEHERMPELTIREARYRTISAARDEHYQIEMTAHGVEVSRNINIEDLRSIRDWCDAAIAASEDASTMKKVG